MVETVNIYKTREEVCFQLAKKLNDISKTGGYVALPGISAPAIFYNILVTYFAETDWSKMNFFWTNENLVPEEDEKSNFGNFYRIVSESSLAASANLFPVMNFKDPHKSLENYKKELSKIPQFRGFPVFDLIILGIGEDGHIASIFSDNIISFRRGSSAELVKNPITGHTSISFTGALLNMTEDIAFICTGAEKADVVDKVMRKKDRKYPATIVQPRKNLFWYIDKAATEKPKMKKGTVKL